jgi:hypothetical protein
MPRRELSTLQHVGVQTDRPHVPVWLAEMTGSARMSLISALQSARPALGLDHRTQVIVQTARRTWTAGRYSPITLTRTRFGLRPSNSP